ncbi:MAG: MarR family winged helix-turn-helix transcriptional regulator [Pseudorhodoplanes sp.]
MPQRTADATTELVLEIFRLNGDLIAMGDALVGDLGLTSARWQVMGAIALANTALPIAQIARNMGLTRQAVQRVANELESEGFLRFAPNPNHQRARLVLLTRKGETAYAAAMGRWEPKAQALGAGSSLKDIETALATLRRVRQRLSKDDR